MSNNKELENLVKLIRDSSTDSICELAKICGRDIKRDYAGADLSNVDLSGEDLSEADFTYTDFTRANLAGANFTGANLKGAIFAHANLEGAILTNAIIDDADFINALLDAGAPNSRPGGRYASNDQDVDDISDTRIDADYPALPSLGKPDSVLADGELELKFEQDDLPRISVFGVGGGGRNAVNHMIASDLQGVGYWVLDTDANGLLLSTAKQRLQLGQKLTRGLGSSGNPVIGQKAAEESRAELAQAIQGTDLLFIAVGMGGGTGTGAAPIIAEVAKEVGALTVAIVTKPFSFEGRKRQRQAEEGIARLAKHVDMTILIPNDKLRESIAWVPLQEAFRAADDALHQGVKGISKLMTKPSLLNVDFVDVRSLMADAGSGLLGIGVGSGRYRASEAAKAAISNPLLESARIEKAKGVLVNISGGKDMTLEDLTTAAQIIYDVLDSAAHIVIGAVVDERLNEEILVTVIATGFDAGSSNLPRPTISSFVDSVDLPLIPGAGEPKASK